MTTLPPVLGVDPGSRYTGIVLVDSAGHLRLHDTISRVSTMTEMSTFLPWLAIQVNTFVRKGIELLESEGQDASKLVLAIEDVVEPKPIRRKGKVQLTNPKHAIETAKVFGYLVAHLEGCTERLVVIPPNKHGDRHEGNATMMHALYAPQLIGPNEKTGTGHGKFHHQRAAWDVADTAREQIRREAMRR